MEEHLVPSAYQIWREKLGVAHGHCPLECESPQPFLLLNRLICGVCWFTRRRVSDMVPCKPETCPE